MARVTFTPHLFRFFPALKEQQPLDVEASTVAALIKKLDQQFPGLAGYLIEENGALRKHVAIYVHDELVRDRVRLSDPLEGRDKVYIFQALSGG